MTFAIHDTARATPVIGRVLDKHLADELGENLTLVIDGRTRHVSGVEPACVADTLLAWRPVIDCQLGREVPGFVQTGAVSWQMGRRQGLHL